ncbi:hypothetical protein FACS1894188_00940 [Clostridia bacterium]|nr:hypothetical protein FACS1894188_00940 [Clostridia bacterium]
MADAKIQAVADKLKAKEGVKLKMLVGFDGFVDEVIHIVDKRQDFNTYTRVETIAEFGGRISEAAGLSANFEFVTQQFKLGGNGPIYANAMAESGHAELTYVGSIGNKTVHDVFLPMAEKSEAVYAVCDPGHTDAVEFNDGKLMLGKHFTLKNITWDNILKSIGGKDKFIELIKQSDLFGMENWTMLPYMSDIWKHVIDEVLPSLPDKEVPPVAFFDLADPAKRTKEDILEAMALIGKFEGKFRAVLGLNKKEAYEIIQVYGITPDESLDEDAQLEKITRELYEKLNIYALVVHPTKEAVVCYKNGFFRSHGPYCEKPVLTTGAGDNFNGGFCLALTLGLAPEDALVSGVGTSGFYVRHAKSPTCKDLIGFIEKWANGEVVD